jgi:hypothetical protein
VIDVTNPASPQLLDTGTTIAGGSPSDVALANAFSTAIALVSVDFVGLYPFLANNPSDIQALPSIVTSDRATGVDAEGSTIVVADAGAGLWVLTIVPLPANEPGAPPAGLRLLDAGPNPFASAARVRFELIEPADVRVEVHSVLGRRVAVLDLGSRPAGVAEVTLDGREWPAGHYLVRVMAGGASVSTRLTRVR